MCVCACTHHVTAGSRCARKCRSRTWRPFTTRWDTWSTSWLTVTYLPCTVMALTALSTKPSGTPSRYPSCPERTRGCLAWTPRSLALTITVSICHQLVKVHFCCCLDIVVVVAQCFKCLVSLRHQQKLLVWLPKFLYFFLT